MKKLLFYLCFTISLIACNNGSQEPPDDSDTTHTPTEEPLKVDTLTLHAGDTGMTTIGWRARKDTVVSYYHGGTPASDTITLGDRFKK